MSQEIFIGTQSDVDSFHVQKLGELLKNEGHDIAEITIHGLRKIRVVLSDKNPEDDTPTQLITVLRRSLFDLIRQNPNTFLGDTIMMKKALVPFEDAIDITENEAARIKEIDDLIATLSFPFEDLPFYAGILSGRKEGDTYIIELLSNNRYPHESDDYSLRFKWKFSPASHAYQTNMEFLKNGESSDDETFGLKKTIEVREEAKILNGWDFVEILQYLQGAQTNRQEEIPENLAFSDTKLDADDAGKTEERIRYLSDVTLPIDTFFPKIPHWSILSKLTYSSIEQLKVQLETWGIPFQTVKFARGKGRLNTLQESGEDRSQIKLVVQKENGSETPFLIVQRASEGRYFNPEIDQEAFSFGLTFGVNEKGDCVLEPIGGTLKEEKISFKAPETSEVTKSSWATISIPCPTKSVGDSITIQGYAFSLTPEQAQKLNSPTLAVDIIEGRGDGIETVRYVRLQVEFTPEAPDDPVLRRITVVSFRDVYRPA